MKENNNIQNASKLLLVSSKRLGDVIFTTPSLCLLRRLKPNATIDVLAFSAIAEQALTNNPHINQLLLAKDHDIKTFEATYDVVLPMINNTLVNTYLEGSTKLKACSRMPFDRHLKDYFNDFLISIWPTLKDDTVGAYELYPAVEDYAMVEQLLEKNNVNVAEQPLIALHLGANRTMRYGESFLKKIFRWRRSVKGSKCWPFENFAKLVDALHKKHPEARFILTGAPSEAYLGKHLKKRPYVINLIGQTKVLQLAALMTLCKTIVTGDTGPLHVACAMNLPVVALFANTDPAVSGPHPAREENTVIYKKTMQDISVDEVVRAVERYL